MTDIEPLAGLPAAPQGVEATGGFAPVTDPATSAVGEADRHERGPDLR
jgi:hypothetical protein